MHYKTNKFNIKIPLNIQNSNFCGALRAKSFILRLFGDIFHILPAPQSEKWIDAAALYTSPLARPSRLPPPDEVCQVRHCAVSFYYSWSGAIYKQQYTDKTLTLRKCMCMRASGASELRKWRYFYILKLLFLSIFGRYIRYFVGTNDMLVGLHVPTHGLWQLLVRTPLSLISIGKIWSLRCHKT